jgi:hypothetical protein
MEAGTAKKPGRPQGSKNRGATTKKEYVLLDQAKFEEVMLGTATGTNSKDSLRDAFKRGVIGEESKVVAIPERYINKHNAKANTRVTLQFNEEE